MASEVTVRRHRPARSPARRVWNAIGNLGKRLSRKGLNDFLYTEVGALPVGARVLNVGAGGAVEVVVRDAGKANSINLVSTDIDASRSPTIVHDICQGPPEAAAFDAVVMAEVLEHLTDPLAGAAAIQAALKPGGRLIVTVPFVYPLHARPHDHFRFTSYGLEQMFGGLDDLTIRARNTWPEALAVVICRLQHERNWTCRLIGAGMTPVLFLLSPLLAGLGRLAPSDLITTGYLVSGQRPVAKPQDTAAS